MVASSRSRSYKAVKIANAGPGGETGQEGIKMIEVNVAAKIKAARAAAEISQAELGSRVGVNQRQVSRWEVGLRVPDAYAIIKIAAALGIDPGALLK